MSFLKRYFNLKKSLYILIISAIFIFIFDQTIKQIILDGFRWQSEYIDIILTYNKGVAFSMFAFLGNYLKYIQLTLLLVLFLYLLYDKKLLDSNSFAFGLIFGAGLGNIYDRFIHEGVVDYIFWHKWFKFAVFNFADMVIDFAIVLILLQSFFAKKDSKY